MMQNRTAGSCVLLVGLIVLAPAMARAHFGRDGRAAEALTPVLGQPVEVSELLGRSSFPAEPARAAAERVDPYVGTKRVLIIRVDFSDRPGESVSAAAAQAIMDRDVAPFFNRSSYGKVTLITTVTPKVYRLSETSVSYATLADPDDCFNSKAEQMHAEAVAAAKADHPGEFDRVVVAHPDIGPALIAGSKFYWWGVSDWPGSRIWINGDMEFSVLAHELGHSFNAMHAGLWRGTRDNPMDPSGTREACGDPCDVMGGGTTTDRDFSAFNKWVMGWLPDGAVRTVSRSGVYRVYRFDTPDADTTRPLALRLCRDGIRYLWFSLRGGTVSSTALKSLANGAYVQWAFHANQNPYLLDLAAPYNRSDEISLNPGTMLRDEANGIFARVIGGGGSGADSYIDIDISLVPQSGNALVAWGLTQSYEPAQPVVPRDFVAIAAGDYHSLALRADGTLWGGFAGKKPPFDITTLPAGVTDIVGIAAGPYVSAAIRRDGKVFVWGDPSSPLLSMPADLANVAALAFGYRHGLALRRDGSVVVFGENRYGVTDVPPGINDAVAVAAGNWTSLVLRRDGSVVSWGMGKTNPTGAVPPTVRDIVAIACSNTASLAVRADGKLIGWGSSGTGVLPVPIVNDAVAVAGAQSHAVVARADGSVVAWGSQNRLTHGFASPRDMILVAPPGVGPVRALSAGLFHNMALVDGLPAPEAGRLTNLSVRHDAGNGDRALIAGFSLAGASPKHVIVRGIGPALRRFGVENPMTNPRLDLFRGETLVAWNDDWTTDDGRSVGAFPLEPATPDAVLAMALAPATYTAQVAPMTEVGGQALVEVYEADASMVENRLTNLSARAQLSQGETLMGGFTVGGGGSRTFVIRAAGPALARFIDGAHPDPKLAIFSGTTRLIENDDWTEDDGASVGAFPFSTGSKDAAVRISLQPGSYTVQVAGGDASGVVLLELYEAAGD